MTPDAPPTDRFNVTWEHLAAGQTLPALTMRVDYRHAIMHVGAGRDYMPGHHDPAYAQAQGVRTVFLNTLFHQSFVDRVLTEWAGPGAFVARRQLFMVGSIYAGDEITGTGRIERRYIDAGGCKRVDLDIEVRTPTELASRAQATLILDNLPF